MIKTARKGFSFMSSTRLKLLRKIAKKTQREIAKVVNVNQNTYSYWENGKVKIDSESIKRLAEYYGVSLDFLSGLPFRLTKGVESWSAEQQQEYYTSSEDKKVYLEYLWGAPVFSGGNLGGDGNNILQTNPEQTRTNNAYLTEHEARLLEAYRSQPTMQIAVDRLLGINEEDVYPVFMAAKSSDNRAPRMILKSKEDWESIENAPDTDEELL